MKLQALLEDKKTKLELYFDPGTDRTYRVGASV
jgi:hypothetical protein